MSAVPATLCAASLGHATGTVGKLPPRPRTIRAGWAHIGVGAFHRAHQAVAADRLLAAGCRDWGIVGGGLRAADAAVLKDLSQQDFFYTLTERSPAGAHLSVIRSIVGLAVQDDNNSLVARLADERVKLITLTVTEDGYCTDPSTGMLDFSNPEIVADIARPAKPRGLYGVLAEALRQRRAGGAGAPCVASCDNIAGNGDLLKASLLSFLERTDPDLACWTADEVRFPNSMVDRITPKCAPEDLEFAIAHTGLADARPVVCEPFWQWVVENQFAADRPPLEDAGVLLVDSALPYEKMKIWLLNGSHQALANCALLASREKFVHEAVADKLMHTHLRRLLDQISPLLEAVPGIDLSSYKKELLERYANPSVRDTIARVAESGRVRLTKFVAPPLLEARRRRAPFERIALTVSAWCARLAAASDKQARDEGMNDARLVRLAAGLADNPAEFVADGGIFPRESAHDKILTSTLAKQAREIATRGIRSAVASSRIEP